MAKRYGRAYTSSRYNTSSNAYDYDTGIFEDDIERMRREAQKKEERENEIIKRKGFIHRIKFTAAIFLFRHLPISFLKQNYMLFLHTAVFSPFFGISALHHTTRSAE